MTPRLFHLDQKLSNRPTARDILLRLLDSFSCEGVFGVDDGLDDPFLKKREEILGISTMRFRGGDIRGEAVKNGNQLAGLNTIWLGTETHPGVRYLRFLGASCSGVTAGARPVVAP